MNNDLDWDTFRVLLAVADGRSFSKGARAAGISQPTATRAIAALEGKLGTRLLVRGPRGVVPTPAGEPVILDARRMAEAAVAASRHAASEGNLEALVRVSVTEGLGVRWLPERLAPLCRANPGLRVDLLIDNAVADLAARQADVAVRLFRPKEPDTVARKVATLAFGLYASPAYLASRSAPRRLADLAKHDLIGHAAPIAPSYLPWLLRYAPAERFVLRASSLLAQHEAARVGFGIAVGTRAILDHDPKLRRVLPNARPPAMDVWLAVHADVRNNPAVSRVYEFLVALFLREAPALRGIRASRTARSEVRRRRG